MLTRQPLNVLPKCGMYARIVSVAVLNMLMHVAISAGATIGVDAIHGYDGDAILATGVEHETFRSVIIGLGHTIVPLHSFEAVDLAGIDAVVLNMPYAQNGADYTASEIAAVQAFVSKRGVFLSDSSTWADDDGFAMRSITFGSNRILLENTVTFVSSGHGGVFIGESGTGSNKGNMNALVASFGISYAGVPTDVNGRTVTGFLPHPVTAGVREIGVDYQLPLTVNAPSLDLTIGDGQDNILAVFSIPEPTSLIAAVLGLACLLANGGRQRRGAGVRR